MQRTRQNLTRTGAGLAVVDMEFEIVLSVDTANEDCGFRLHL